jgi:hypothetical protein
MPAGKNHDHEGCSNRERRNYPRRTRYDRAPDRENEEESANEFSEVFVHF